MVRTIVAGVLVLVCLAVAFGQEAPDVAGESGGGAVAFLAGLSGLDEGLCGETRVKLMYEGVELGDGKLVVAAAPEESGGTYLVRMTMSLEMGPTTMKAAAESVLDEKLALVSADYSMETSGMEEAEREVTRIRKTDGHWIWTQTVDDEVSTSRIVADRPNHGDDLAVILIGRKLAGCKPGGYDLQGIDWPEDEEPAPDLEASWSKRSFQVEETGTTLFGELEVETRVVRRTDSDGGDAAVTVGTDGRFLSFTLPGTPVTIIDERLVGESEEELTEPTGADTPRAAVAVYFEVLAGIADVDALDAVVDWAAVYASAAATKPEVASLTARKLRLLTKAEMERRAGMFSREQIGRLVPGLRVVVTGERAVVNLPGKEDEPFELEKTETGWVITRIMGT